MGKNRELPGKRKKERRKSMKLKKKEQPGKRKRDKLGRMRLKKREESGKRRRRGWRREEKPPRRRRKRRKRRMKPSLKSLDSVPWMDTKKGSVISGSSLPGYS